MTATKQPVKADETCKLSVKDGKVWCDTHATADHPIDTEWFHHREHGRPPEEAAIKRLPGDHQHGGQVRLPFRHVLYSGTLCPCGVILIDQEQ